MKDSRQFLIKKMLCQKTNTKFSRKEQKLYYLNLHEDFYANILQKKHNLLKGNKKRNSLPTRNFLAIKRVIIFLHNTKNLGPNTIFLQKKQKHRFLLKKKNLFKLVLESTAFILLSIDQENQNFSETIFSNPKTNISLSIHKPLEYIENQWQSKSSGFSGSICSLLHPEILLRLLRKNVEDISLLHLIRKLLHFDFLVLENIPSIAIQAQNYSLVKLTNLLWNFYTLEIDHFFFGKCKDYFFEKKSNCSSFVDYLSCLEKTKGWTDFVEKKEENVSNQQRQNCCSILKKTSSFNKSITYKYLRVNNVWLVSFQKEKPWDLFLTELLIRFFVRRLGYFPNSDRILPIFSKNSYLFLGYLLEFPKKEEIVKIHRDSSHFNTSLRINLIYELNPIMWIIALLTEQNFCTSSGYPISKSGWSTWTDIEIIEQCKRIRDNIFLFYSGCHNRKALSRIQHILHFSCAKTLACKHKMTIRRIWKKYGRNLSIKDPHYSTEKAAYAKFGRLPNKFLMNRVWNLQLKQMESTSLTLDTKYNPIMTYRN